MLSSITRAGLAAGVIVAAGSSTFGASYSQPTFDRWNYGFNGTPGTRTNAPTFSDGGYPDAFDLRDGQFLNSFVTSAEFMPGKGVGNYLITSATLTATILAPTGYVYGGTGGVGPVELFGTGFRNGYTATSFGETGPYTDAPSVFPPGVRNAYAADLNGLDASNNAAASVFALGTVAGKNLGDPILAGDVFTFSLDLGNPQIMAYLASGLNGGILSFSLASLEAAAPDGSGPYPVFATKESGVAAVTLDITADVVPAPGVASLLALGGIGMIGRRRRA